MVEGNSKLKLGLPRMGQEPGERRDFLPSLARHVAESGTRVVVEGGLGAGMGYSDDDYASVSDRIEIADRERALAQEVVLVLRSPDDRFQLMRSGATLLSMLHFPTRPARSRRLKELGIEAVALDCIVDDHGRRMVENTEAVAWNGLDAAFRVLASSRADFHSAERGPIRVTVLGAGMVGKHAVEAATKYGSPERTRLYESAPGVEVTVIGRNLSRRPAYMRERLRVTDVLVDATYRSDASVPIVPNTWLSELPLHSVICDLSVDPYLMDADPPTVRGIEGIPQGDLDKYLFLPGDDDWDERIPPGIPTEHRRTTVTCYSWPGVKPEACMRTYEEQIIPLLDRLLHIGGAGYLSADGGYLERALWRGSLQAHRA
jgi:alanine dehydrogenase